MACSYPEELARFQFVAEISRMGDNRIIWIPKKYHKDIAKLEGKQIKIVLDDTY